MKTLLQNISGLTALVTGITLLLSIIHEWIYFLRIGPEFMAMMSLGDFLIAALIWLPSAVLSVFVGYVVDMFSTRIEGGMTEDEIAATSSNPSFTKKFRASPMIVIMVLSVIFGPLNFLVLPNEPIYAFIIAIMVLWVVFVSWVLGHPRLSKRFSPVSRSLFLIGPLIVIFVLGNGAKQARDDLRATSGNDIIYTNNRVIDNVLVLRAMGAGVLFRQASGSAIEIINWRNIVRIDRKNVMIEKQSRACRWFNVLCLNKKETPPKKNELAPKNRTVK